MVNSRFSLFTAAPSGSSRKVRRPTGAPLIPKSRSYFAEFLNEGYLDHLSILYLPTCVGFGTGACTLPRGFSRRHGVRNSPAYSQLTIASHVKRQSLKSLRYSLVARQPSRAIPSLPRPPVGQTITTRYRNINLLAIDYAFRPRLRTRLTLGRRALPRKPWTIGGGDSHPSFVTNADILTPRASKASLRCRFSGTGTLSYRAK